MSDARDLPPALAARPWDSKRQVPIPLMNMRPVDLDANAGALPPELGGDPSVDWIGDFTAIYAPIVYQCGRDRLCGLCGEPLGYWIAFMGGPNSFANRLYQDPPFCVPCAEAATRLCPHIAIPHHRRAPDHRLADPDAPQAAGFDATRTEEWVMGITRDYKIDLTSTTMLFRPAPFKTTRRFIYSEGSLQEVHR